METETGVEEAPLVQSQEDVHENGEISTQQRSPRLISLDMFRGLCVVVMIFVDECGDDHPEWIGHSAWNGIRLADFVLPWFLFIMGVSLAAVLAQLPQSKVDKQHVLTFSKRGLKLYMLGVFLQGGLPLEGPEPFGYNLRTLRFCGILNRIGFAFAFCSLVELASLRLDIRGMSWLIHFVLTALVWFITFFLHVPSWISTWGPSRDGTQSIKLLHENETFVVECQVHGVIDSPACSAAGYLDRVLFGQDHLGLWFSKRMSACSSCSPRFCPRLGPEFQWCQSHMYDPEGFLSTIACLLTVKIGLQVGTHLFTRSGGQVFSSYRLLSAGLGMTLGGVLLDVAGLPFNKQLYSTSYLLFMCGTGTLMLLGLFYVLDRHTHPSSLRRKLCQPVVNTGKNALLVFILHGPLEWLVDLVFWADPLDAANNKRHNLMLFLRDDLMGGSTVLFALFKTIAFVTIAEWATRNKIRVQV